MFSSQFFAGNRDRLREKLAGKPAFLAGNGLLQRKNDTTAPFSQESNVWYLSGIELPDVVLVIGVNSRDDAVIVPGRTEVQSAFNGAVDEDDIRNTSGIDKVLSQKMGMKYLKSLMNSHKNNKDSEAYYVLAPEPTYDKQGQYYSNPAQKRFYDQAKRQFKGLKPADAKTLIGELRAIKQPEEIRAIEKAIQLTTSALQEVQKGLADGKYTSENEIEASITYQFRRNGAKDHAYAPIVASGKNATTLHYVANDAKIGDNKLIVIDVGAEVCNYAADITRTLQYGTMSSRQKAVYEAVLDVQKKAINLIRPGLTFRDFEVKTREFLAVKMLGLGLISSLEDKENIRKYYPHATTHFLGLDVHDVGDYNQPMQDGMVITCEPGIYIPEEGIGVRIEDDILLTKNGNKNLSASCPK